MTSRTAAAIARMAMARGALQKEAELRGLVELLECELIPESAILEIGCDAGGTLHAWSCLSDHVIGVTLPDGEWGSGRPLDPPPDSHIVQGDSHDPGTLAMVEDILDELQVPVGLVFIDGDHTYSGTMQDWRMYGTLTAPRGLVAFHDICHHDDPRVGVERAWAAIWESQLGPVPEEPLGRWRWEFVHPPENWGGIGVYRTFP